jgi:hypothetical protein
VSPTSAGPCEYRPAAARRRPTLVRRTCRIHLRQRQARKSEVQSAGSWAGLLPANAPRAPRQRRHLLRPQSRQDGSDWRVGQGSPSRARRQAVPYQRDSVGRTLVVVVQTRRVRLGREHRSPSPRVFPPALPSFDSQLGLSAVRQRTTRRCRTCWPERRWVASTWWSTGRQSLRPSSWPRAIAFTCSASTRGSAASSSLRTIADGTPRSVYQRQERQQHEHLRSGAHTRKRCAGTHRQSSRDLA